MSTNHQLFGPVLKPLTKPTYVLRMAQSREWSETAQVRNLTRMREALARSLAVCDAALATMPFHVHDGRDMFRCDICGQREFHSNHITRQQLGV